jgi:phytoene synthase
MDGLAWCRERMLVAGQPLTASLLFADPDERDRILVLRTLISELAAIPDASSDAGVAQAKLSWWMEAAQTPDNAHPLLVAARDVGLMARIDEALWRQHLMALIEGVEVAIAAPRMNQIQALWQHCERVAGPAASLETALLGGADEEAGVEAALRQLAAAGYWIRLVRDLAGDAHQNRWLVPLALQADYQINRQDVLEGKVSSAWDGLVRALLSEALKRAQQAIATLDGSAAWWHRHQLITYALHRRLAAQLARRPRRILSERILPGPWGNVWCAWRSARHLSRQRFATLGS